MKKLFLLLLLFFAQPAFADVAYVTSSSAITAGGGALTLSTSFDITSVTNGYAIIGIVEGSSVTITACSFGGVTCDSLHSVVNYTGSINGETWGVKLGTASGTKTLSITFSSATTAIADIAIFGGVDQTTPTTGEDHNATYSPTGTCSINISGSGTTGMVFSHGASSFGTSLTATTGTSFGIINAYESLSGGGSYLAGSASAVAASWADSANNGCFVIGIAILPSGGGGPPATVVRHMVIQQ